MSVWRHAGAALLLVGMGATGTAAPIVCGEPLPPGPRQRAHGAGYELVWQASVWPIPVGQHFSMDLQVCGPPGAAVPTQVRVDADMPAHRHGMNYQTTVAPLGDGRFRADGLMFHMTGRWRLVFELQGTPQAVRITQEVLVE